MEAGEAAEARRSTDLATALTIERERAKLAEARKPVLVRLVEAIRRR